MSNINKNNQLSNLFANNNAWRTQITDQNPDFFLGLSRLQSPEYLWIGCSDSRVPANDIVGLKPGELFVHRNIANMVHSSDMNCLTVLKYSIEVLKVKHIIVTGHYGCGGIKAALEGSNSDIIDNWLSPVNKCYKRHKQNLDQLDGEQRVDKLCELNVIEQVYNVCQIQAVKNAWKDERSLTVHGWIYGLKDGKLHDLGVTINSLEQADELFDLK
jgi:carbonic anhydrase